MLNLLSSTFSSFTTNGSKKMMQILQRMRVRACFSYLFYFILSFVCFTFYIYSEMPFFVTRLYLNYNCAHDLGHWILLIKSDLQLL